MRFASVGSGSKGNALVVEAGRTRVLLDCGFGPRNLTERLSRLGLRPDQIDAVLITHEHSDHVAGAFPCARQFGAALYMTHGTLSGVRLGKPGLIVDDIALQLIDGHRPIEIGDLSIQPFPVPHDAREPVQFVFSDGKHRLGVLTDLGCSTPHVERQLSGCDALVLECNHDTTMLVEGAYPLSLKQRIGGRFGHLDNAAAAALLGCLDTSRLQHIVAAHLSEQNNTPALAQAALAATLGCAAEWIGVADQESGFGWRGLM